MLESIEQKIDRELDLGNKPLITLFQISNSLSLNHVVSSILNVEPDYSYFVTRTNLPDIQDEATIVSTKQLNLPLLYSLPNAYFYSFTELPNTLSKKDWLDRCREYQKQQSINQEILEKQAANYIKSNSVKYIKSTVVVAKSNLKTAREIRRDCEVWIPNFVAFVDVRGRNVYIRCKSSHSARLLKGYLGEARILEGREEKRYFDEIREIKKSNKQELHDADHGHQALPERQHIHFDELEVNDTRDEEAVQGIMKRPGSDFQEGSKKKKKREHLHFDDDSFVL